MMPVGNTNPDYPSQEERFESVPNYYSYSKRVIKDTGKALSQMMIERGGEP
jgi:hypothetical protein